MPHDHEHGKTFTLPLLNWFNTCGRKHLPWQKPGNPYFVWISEIMLQQTQVQTVIPYFERFVSSFPDIFTLASAHEDMVLAHWSGLGYYSRARNLHKTAKMVCEQFNGQFPGELQQLLNLPGIGPSTAGAIISLAFNQPAAILDGNVKRVLSRFFMVDGVPSDSKTEKKLWQLANLCLSKEQPANYTQAIMDLGATCCTAKNPECQRCPVQNACRARQHNKTELYPWKKPARIRPVKQQQFLLMHTHDQLVYLEKRPPSGLWGGLWCLPAIEPDRLPLDFIRKRYGLDGTHIKKLIDIKHSFTHFHCHITSLAIQVQIPAHSVAEHAGQWFSMSELENLGLSKPICQIIACWRDI